MSEEINELVVFDAAGELTCAEKVDIFLDQVVAYKAALEEKEKEFRKVALTAMMENGILSVKTDKYVISQVIPKDTVTFDTDKFLKEADCFVVDEYTSYKKTKQFNLDALLAAHPELVEEFTEEVMVPEVDVKKLAKKEPDIYNAYATITKSEKPVTIRIAAAK